MEPLLGQDETLEEFNRLTTEKPEILRLVDGMTDDLLEQIKEVDFDDWEDFSACTLCHAAVGWYRSVDSRTEGVVGALNTLLRRSR